MEKETEKVFLGTVFGSSVFVVVQFENTLEGHKEKIKKVRKIKQHFAEMNEAWVKRNDVKPLTLG